MGLWPSRPRSRAWRRRRPASALPAAGRVAMRARLARASCLVSARTTPCEIVLDRHARRCRSMKRYADERECEDTSELLSRCEHELYSI